MIKGYCEKCKKFGLVEDHHILPLSTFGKNEEKIKLCPNCHSDYHNYFGRKNLKNPNIEFQLNSFFKWLYLLPVIGLLLYFLL